MASDLFAARRVPHKTFLHNLFGGSLILFLLYYLLTAITAAAAFAALYYINRRKAAPDPLTTDSETKFSKLIRSPEKLMALLYGALFFVRYMGGDYALQSTIALNQYSPFGPSGSVSALFSVLLLWLLYAAQLVTITYPFFKNSVREITPIAKYLSPAIYAISFISMPVICRALDGELADTLHWRLVIFSLEIGVGLALSLFHLFDGERERYGAKSILKTAAIFVGMFLINLPPWAPQCIFGEGSSDMLINDLNIFHRLTLYVALALGLSIHFLFRKCSYEVRRYAMLYISWSTMVSFCFNYNFDTFITPTSWPIHLCHTAMFIIPIVLVFKASRLYYFTLFINVLGAFLAMIMPNTSTAGILSAGMFEFWINHYMAFLLPMLVISLRIFERPKMRQFTYSLIAFFCYYVFVLFMNAWLTNYDSGVDFFFINSNFVAEKLGKWAEDIRDITASFNIGDLVFKLYPVYQFLYFTVYILLSFAMWFLYEQAFEIADVYQVISERNSKIRADRLALEVHLAGRSMQEPKSPENEGKLILRHFSKRYSTSDVYSAYDVNLEIDGGQIFGFLGPNGAGKSTIIKSIVGIQTITSGEIEVSGYDVEKQSVGAKMQIGFVPDHYALYENLTGREYLNYIADLYNVSRADRDERIADFVNRFRLEAAIDNPMKTYSHGMKQKITLMSALVHSPKVWILDEPLTGLDPESIFQVKEAMKEHAKKGNIVFFSSHIIDVVENICDRIAIIRRGQILCVRSVAEIKESGIPLEKFYMDMIDGNTQPPVSVKEAEAALAGSKVV